MLGIQNKNSSYFVEWWVALFSYCSRCFYPRQCHKIAMFCISCYFAKIPTAVGCMKLHCVWKTEGAFDNYWCVNIEVIVGDVIFCLVYFRRWHRPFVKSIGRGTRRSRQRDLRSSPSPSRGHPLPLSPCNRFNLRERLMSASSFKITWSTLHPSTGQPSVFRPAEYARRWVVCISICVIFLWFLFQFKEDLDFWDFLLATREEEKVNFRSTCYRNFRTRLFNVF